MQRVRRNDLIQIISGKDKDKRGRVLRVLPTRGKVLVEGLNLVTKHERTRMNRQGAQEGGISQREALVDLSNVMPICPSTNQPTRVATRVVDGRRVRWSVKGDVELPER